MGLLWVRSRLGGEAFEEFEEGVGFAEVGEEVGVGDLGGGEGWAEGDAFFELGGGAGWAAVAADEVGGAAELGGEGGHGLGFGIQGGEGGGIDGNGCEVDVPEHRWFLSLPLYPGRHAQTARRIGFVGGGGQGMAPGEAGVSCAGSCSTVAR